MKTNKTLAIDYSTSCTGYAIFCNKSRKLLDYGYIKPKVKGLSKLFYPKRQLYVTRAIADELFNIISKIRDLDTIVIEEINRHKSRLAGKVLDGGHFILLNSLLDEDLDKVVYIDSDGADGWRSANGLNLLLSKEDKKENQKRKAEAKKSGKTAKPINKKHLACRFVNKKFSLNLDVDERPSDGDIADAIGLGYFFLHRGERICHK